jgi:hypothetical protein
LAVLECNLISIAFIIKVGLSKKKRKASKFARSYPSHPFRKQYGIASTTIYGEQVKSIGEKTIADYLCGKGIRYYYESPAYTLDRQFISKPDFYLPDYDVYLEYWGMLEVANPRKRAEYVESMNWKLDKYARNNIKIISLYQEDLDDLNKTLHGRLPSRTSE